MSANDSRRTPSKLRQRSHETSGSVAIAGLGNWGTALAWALHGAGIRITELVVRGQPDAAEKKLAKTLGAVLTEWRSATPQADVVWLCMADGQIEAAASELAKRWRKNGRPPRVVLHSSGVLGSEVLGDLHEPGVAVGSAHPFASFPQRRAVQLTGTFFGIEGDAAAVKAARRLVGRMGGNAFTVPTGSKALYHAFGTMASPLLVALLQVAQETGERAGIAPRTVAELLRSLAGGTFENWHKNGAAASFSGPISRGDAETIALHLASLRGTPELDAIYRALAGYAVERLSTQNKDQLRKVLRSDRKTGKQVKQSKRGRA